MKQQMSSDFFTNYYEGYLDRLIKVKQHALTELAEAMTRRMTRLVENVAENKGFNSLGEIQGLGSEIDRVTGELATLNNLKADLKSQIQYAEILAGAFDEDQFRKELDDLG